MVGSPVLIEQRYAYRIEPDPSAASWSRRETVTFGGQRDLWELKLGKRS